MPELPEVTTIVRDLNRSVRGRIIRDVWTDTPKLVQPLSIATVRRRLMGKRFEDFERRGKFVLGYVGNEKRETRKKTRSSLLISRSPSLVLVWHMRMTGHPLFRDPAHETPQRTRAFADPRNQHIRFKIFFTDGTRLEYSDVRKFGTLQVVAPHGLPRHPALRTLGPDALQTRWTAETVCARLQKRRTTLKQALMDQTVIAGIGNIYADEILWAACLHPRLPTRRLTDRACQALARVIPTILRRALRARGTSIDDFRDLRGERGTYGNIRRVYQRAGESCFRCGGRIARLTLGGRGTHVCPRCQRLPARRTRT